MIVYFHAKIVSIGMLASTGYLYATTIMWKVLETDFSRPTNGANTGVKSSQVLVPPCTLGQIGANRGDLGRFGLVFDRTFSQVLPVEV